MKIVFFKAQNLDEHRCPPVPYGESVFCSDPWHHLEEGKINLALLAAIGQTAEFDNDKTEGLVHVPSRKGKQVIMLLTSLGLNCIDAVTGKPRVLARPNKHGGKIDGST